MTAEHHASSRRRLAAAALLAVYPVAVISRVLASGSHHRLRAVGADPDLLTDFDGGVRLGWILRDVLWPWSSSTMSGYPDGESLMRWQTVAQGIQFGAIHLLTRLFEPAVALNVLVLVGWLVTGAATAALARRLGLGVWPSIAAGVLAQLLPSMPTMAANYTSYVFIGIPVYAVCRAIDASEAPTRRNLAALAGVLVVTLFFDPYWFYFAGFAAAIVLIAKPGPLIQRFEAGPRWLRLLGFLVVLLMLLVPLLVLTAGGGATSGVVSRAVSVETARFVDAGLRRPSDWLRSSYEGVGWVVALLSTAAIVRAVWTRPRGAPFVAAVTTIALVAMSTRTTVSTPWFTIGSLAEYLRFVMPGVRFFQRSALIAEAMLCVFAVIGARDLARYVTRRVGSPRRALGLAVVVPLLTVTVFEFAPLDRPVSDRWDDFAEFRSILDESDRAVVLAVPFRRHGRDWLEFSMLDEVTTSNQLYSTEREDLTAVGSSHGPEAFAGYLASIGVTHVMSIVGPGGYPLQYRLEEPWFVPRSEMVLNAYENEPETVQLLEVRGDPTSSPIEGCPDRCVVGPGYPFLRTALEIVDLGGDGGDRAIDDDRSWWMVEREMTVQLSMVTLSTLGYAAAVDIAIENPCGGAVEVGVTFDGEQRWLSVAAYETTDVSLGIDQTNLASFIEITSDGEPCAAGPDDADAHLRVFRPVLVDPVDR